MILRISQLVSGHPALLVDIAMSVLEGKFEIDIVI
jgi:hypothetical protein